MLWSTGAREVVEPATPEERQLVNVVEEMAIASGLPRPRVWIVPDDDPNAFATGRDAATASIAVTEGLLRTLIRDELQGVVAHEMAHVQNLDVRLMTLLAGMVGRDRADVGRDGADDAGQRDAWARGGRSGGGGAVARAAGIRSALVVLVLWLLTLVVAPIVSRILAMAVSRKREYLADATGAQFTRNPLALASALEKLEARLGAHARDHPRRGASLHRRSGAGAALRARGLLRRRAGLPSADPPADRPAAGHGVPARRAAPRLGRAPERSLRLSSPDRPCPR